MEKICLIKQPIGIGDICYLQKFAQHFKRQGYKIIWPIRDDILWLSDYINGVNFCAASEDFVGKQYFFTNKHLITTDNFIYISPDGYQVPGKRIMESKYLMINESDHDWYDYFSFNRNTEKENELYYNVLGLDDNSQYVFINKMASVDVRFSNAIDGLTFDLPVVELQILDGYTLFDWCKVFENAKELHTVHTGINYILDKLDLTADKYYMYQGLHLPDVQYIPFKKCPVFIPNVGD